MRRPVVTAVLLAASLAACGGSVMAQPLAAAESAYADWLDATYAVSTLASGALASLDGRDLAAWRARLPALTARAKRDLAIAARQRLSAEDTRALARMRVNLANPPDAPATTSATQSAARCARAGNPRIGRVALSAALYGCFESLGDHIAFEHRSIARATALELLQRLPDAERRKALFDALAPLWRSINAADGPSSPYRRLIRLAAAEQDAQHASPLAAAARTLGLCSADAESWLTAALERWRAVNPGEPIEPWDYWSHYATPVRSLDPLIPAARITPLSFAYYRDLGLDLAHDGAIHDLAARPGKAPLAYADFVRIGRRTPAGWRPALARVSGNVEEGGLFALNEIVHEDGHVAHMLAVRTRPAFFDLGDDLFIEAFADVTSWAVVSPAWQRRYLGQAIEPAAGKRALLANVILDLAWSLFEIRLLRQPTADPNRVWTEITARYLNIRPHPELSWWALRVQLVDTPGYMINYGLGAVLTADLRRRIAELIGVFDGGNPRWYGFVSRGLLRFGASRPTVSLLRDFLARPVSDQALLQAINSLAPSRS